MSAIIAVVDDEPRMADILGIVLKRDGHTVHVFHAPADCLAAMDGIRFDAVLTDLKMPGMDGVSLLKAVKERQPELPVILITAHATIETAIDAMRHGAFDYLQKPVDNRVCRAAVRRALENTQLRRENAYLRAQVSDRHGIGTAIAESPVMRQVMALVKRAAASHATVLVTGESGTGKELLARAIHVHSPRVAGPFVAVNCKAFAGGVLESELFGHEKGAFTGADHRRQGVFERASGGTLFLDEIGEIDEAFQAKLLRVLQEGEVQPVGANQSRQVDVRVVVATNRDLAKEVKEGRFREDLYFRVAVIPVHLPPLRARMEDVLPLARLFLARANDQHGRQIEGWTPAVQRWMLGHHWPGNVRELANTMERGAVLARDVLIDLPDLMITSSPGGKATATGTLQDHLDEAAADKIRAALNAVGWVRVDAAERLGVERTTLYRLMRKYGIEEVKQD